MSADVGFSWRAYATDAGLTPMTAWVACQHATPIVTPADLDRACADPAMHAVIRAVIDDAAA